MLIAATPSTPAEPDPRTARTTGLLYLALAITGGLSFMGIRARIVAEGSPTATLAHVLEQESLARAWIGLELGAVILQALVALWFYQMFRSVNTFTAGTVAVFGLINAIALLGSAAFLATALQVALRPIGAASGLPHLMYMISANLWGVGNLFFGLWLIPMGLMVLVSRWAPRVLGWLLVTGGVAYVLSGLLAFLVPNSGAVVDALVIPPTIAELWMIGWLLRTGRRRTGRAEPTAQAEVSTP